jgi:class 3 adenylate cyclase
MALAMRPALASVAVETGLALDLRVGIDTGPTVAGVIGRAKFIYDLWGDTVNTASRMESHAPPGTIQVTSRAFEILRERYEFAPRGPIEVKGKGMMDAYLLLARRDERTGLEGIGRVGRAQRAPSISVGAVTAGQLASASSPRCRRAATTVA